MGQLKSLLLCVKLTLTGDPSVPDRYSPEFWFADLPSILLAAFGVIGAFGCCFTKVLSN